MHTSFLLSIKIKNMSSEKDFFFEKELFETTNFFEKLG